VGRRGTIREICDGVGVPQQANRRRLVFIELKTSGKYAKAIRQIRAGVAAILSHDIPRDVALSAEIWSRREPKSTINGSRIIQVEGRKVFVRHRRSEA